MNVDFDDKAGNAGDVLKHVVLAWLLHELASLRIPVTYLETHAGRGCYSVDPSKGGRAHLLEPLPAHDDGPTAPALAVLRRHLHRTGDSAWRYPGSPLFAMELLRGSAAGVFFERDEARRVSLVDCATEARSAGVQWVRPGAVGCDVWTGDGGNKLRGHLQRAYGVGATARPSTVLALVDPFAYVTDRQADTSRGEIGRAELERLALWCKEVAAGARVEGCSLCAPMSGILMVWTKSTGPALQDDLTALRDRMPQPACVQSFGIERRGDLLDYAVVVLGYGSTGERVVGKLGHDGPDGARWSRSRLLQAWGYRLIQTV